MAPGVDGLADTGPAARALYRLVARHRYQWFGRSETCLLPPADYAQRFLD